MWLIQGLRLRQVQKQEKQSSQDGGISRNASLPHTIKRRVTTDLKTTNNQKCPKINLHGTLTTKQVKKHSPRQRNVAQMKE